MPTKASIINQHIIVLLFVGGFFVVRYYCFGEINCEIDAMASVSQSVRLQADVRSEELSYRKLGVVMCCPAVFSKSEQHSKLTAHHVATGRAKGTYQAPIDSKRDRYQVHCSKRNGTISCVDWVR